MASQYLILAQSELTASALGKWLELLGETALEGVKDPRLIVVHDVAFYSKTSAVQLYENLVGQIEERAEDKSERVPPSELTVLVDSLQPYRLNPLDEEGWDHLIAMLILTFPEIRWVFGMISRYPDEIPQSEDQAILDDARQIKENWKTLEPNHSLPSLLLVPRRTSLFDASGLRNFVRRLANHTLLKAQISKAKEQSKLFDAEKLQKSLLPLRPVSAAAIDEEVNYATYHAYVAYRFGYRAEAVTSWQLMEHLFKEQKEKHGFDLLMEDVNLNFPDKTGEIHLSRFEEHPDQDTSKNGRAHFCPLLNTSEKSKFRIIVTSGHSGADADKMLKNKDFIKSYKSKSERGYVLKPVGGVFDFWDNMKLFDRLDPRRGRSDAGLNPGQPPGYIMPPVPSLSAEEAGGHSAPGKLMLIAKKLIQRAEPLLHQRDSLDMDLLGAVLSTEALELLRFQTPTLALQALSMKHEFEVKAEVAFIGVGHHFDLHRRFQEMFRDTLAATRFFERKRRKLAEYDTLVSIANRLMVVFREAGQFDEEMCCLIKIRHWHRKLRKCMVLHNKRYWEMPFQWLMSYAEWLLAKPSNFIGALLIWLFVLTSLWYGLEKYTFHNGLYVIDGLTKKTIPIIPIEPKNSMEYLRSAISKAMPAFSAGETNEVGRASWYGFGLQAISSISGMFHFGVFISYLYSSVSRK